MVRVGRPMSSALALLQWWRPLVLGAPPPPRWAVGLSDGAGRPKDGLLDSAARQLQSRFRARRARRRTAEELRNRAESAAVHGHTREHLLPSTRAALMLCPSALASVRLLCAVLEPTAGSARASARASEVVDCSLPGWPLHGWNRGCFDLLRFC